MGRVGGRSQPQRIPSIQPSAANQGAGFWEWWENYTRQTPTKNDFFNQSTVPVFGISTREIPVNTIETLRFFRHGTSRIRTAKNRRQLGFKWRLVSLPCFLK